MKIKLLSILLTSVLLLCACSNPNTSSYIGSRHQPILFDGTHIYGGMGTDLLSFVSTTTTTYSPLCMNPTCDHSRSNESCEARSTITINSFTLSSDGNVIVGGRDPADPFTYSAILLNTTTGKHQYIIKQIPNNINAMLVINDTLYFFASSLKT